MYKEQTHKTHTKKAISSATPKTDDCAERVGTINWIKSSLNYSWERNIMRSRFFTMICHFYKRTMESSIYIPVLYLHGHMMARSDKGNITLIHDASISCWEVSLGVLYLFMV